MTKIVTFTLDDLKVRDMGIKLGAEGYVVTVNFPILTDSNDVYSREVAYYKEAPQPITQPNEFRLPASMIPVLDDLLDRARTHLGKQYLDES